MEDPSSQSGRWDALYGAWLCGFCLGTASMPLHHKLCQTLGGSFNLRHAATHIAVLPHALSYVAPSIPQAMKQLDEALPESSGDAVKGLKVLLTKLRVRRSLRELGVKEEDIDRAAEMAMSRPYWSPRGIGKDGLRELIRRCWAGEEARADF